MGIFLAVIIILAVGFVALMHSRYAVYFHWQATPISAKQWRDMTYEQKADYSLITMLMALKYYHEEPLSWMVFGGPSQLELEPVIQKLDDVAATSHSNDATFGRLIRIQIFDSTKQMLKAQRQGKCAAPSLTGIEWLSWSPERKQALVANYISIAVKSAGSKKTFRPEEVSSLYIDSIDKTAKQHPTDPRLPRFIGNLISQMMNLLIEEFVKQKQATHPPQNPQNS